MGIRLLLIEDDVALAEFVTRGLKEEGYVVIHAATGMDGRQQLYAAAWDLVLLDWKLPDEDGVALLQENRERGDSTPILFLTARNTASEHVYGHNSGADDYLCKPFTFEELLIKVRAITHRRVQAEPAMLSCEDVVIHLNSQRIERDGKRLDLTMKEQLLLTYFVRHSGEILSRTRIYDQVWNERFNGISNSLEVHVMELRKKLEAHGPRLIFTVRGRGYVFGKAR